MFSSVPWQLYYLLPTPTARHRLPRWVQARNLLDIALTKARDVHALQTLLRAHRFSVLAAVLMHLASTQRTHPTLTDYTQDCSLSSSFLSLFSYWSPSNFYQWIHILFIHVQLQFCVFTSWFPMLVCFRFSSSPIRLFMSHDHCTFSVPSSLFFSYLFITFSSFFIVRLTVN